MVENMVGRGGIEPPTPRVFVLSSGEGPCPSTGFMSPTSSFVNAHAVNRARAGDAVGRPPLTIVRPTASAAPRGCARGSVLLVAAQRRQALDPRHGGRMPRHERPVAAEHDPIGADPVAAGSAAPPRCPRPCRSQTPLVARSAARGRSARLVATRHRGRCGPSQSTPGRRRARCTP